MTRPQVVKPPDDSFVLAVGEWGALSTVDLHELLPTLWCCKGEDEGDGNSAKFPPEGHL